MKIKSISIVGAARALALIACAMAIGYNVVTVGSNPKMGAKTQQKTWTVDFYLPSGSVDEWILLDRPTHRDNGSLDFIANGHSVYLHGNYKVTENY